MRSACHRLRACARARPRLTRSAGPRGVPVIACVAQHRAAGAAALCTCLHAQRAGTAKCAPARAPSSKLASAQFEGEFYYLARPQRPLGARGAPLEGGAGRVRKGAGGHPSVVVSPPPPLSRPPVRTPTRERAGWRAGCRRNRRRVPQSCGAVTARTEGCAAAAAMPPSSTEVIDLLSDSDDEQPALGGGAPAHQARRADDANGGDGSEPALKRVRPSNEHSDAAAVPAGPPPARAAELAMSAAERLSSRMHAPSARPTHSPSTLMPETQRALAAAFGGPADGAGGSTAQGASSTHVLRLATGQRVADASTFRALAGLQPPPPQQQQQQQQQQEQDY